MPKRKDYSQEEMILETWQVWNALKSILGEAYICKNWKVAPRTLAYWCADPKYVDEVRKNPIDRILEHLKELNIRGRKDIAIACAKLFAEAVKRDLPPADDEIIPDKETIEAECLDDYPALVEFHKAKREKKSKKELKFLADKVKKEIDETVAI